MRRHAIASAFSAAFASLSVSCGDDSTAGQAGSGSGGASTETSNAATSPSGTSGDDPDGAGGGGGTAPVASIFPVSDGDLVRVRIDGTSFTDADDAPGAWRLEVDGAEVDLTAPSDAGIFARRGPAEPARIEAVYLQARSDVAPGDEVVVEHRSAGTRWTFVARTASGPRFTLHPIVLHDPDGSGTDADVLAEISSAWSTTEASCGIALQVEPTIAVTVDDPTELVRGITAIDEEERPADLIVPRSIDEVFDAAGVPDDALRVVIWPSASPLAATPRFYEFEGELNYAPTMLAYDGIENGEIVGAEPTTALRYRFALGNDQDSEGPDGEAWPWSVIIVHEIGHMLGLGHPDQTVDTSDDLTDNLMAGTHDYPESYGEAGQFANVTQRQCLQLALDLNGYADP